MGRRDSQHDEETHDEEEQVTVYPGYPTSFPGMICFYRQLLTRGKQRNGIFSLPAQEEKKGERMTATVLLVLFFHGVGC